MKVINFKGFKDVPVCARVMYGIAVVCALIGITLIFLYFSDIYNTETCMQLAFCTAGAVINNVVLFRFRDKLYKDVSK